MEQPPQAVALAGEHYYQSTNAAFNPAGTHVLVQTHNNITLHDANTGKIVKQLKPLPSTTRGCLSAKWSPQGAYIKGKFLAGSIGDFHNVIHIWDQHGQWLYQLHYHPRAKIYFTPTDQQVIEKQEKDFWHIKEAATGNTLAILGNPTDGNRKIDQDPQGLWITIYDGKESRFYDAKNFALITAVTGLVSRYSPDGTRFVSREDYSWTATVYSRDFQRLFKLSNMLCAFDFTSANTLLICYLAGFERHFDVRSGEQVRTLNNHSDSSNWNDLEFSTEQADTVIKCVRTKSGSDVFITDSHTTKGPFSFPSVIRNIFYTRIKDVIGLGEYNYIQFFLHLPSGKNVPCKMTRGSKGVLFKRKQIATTTQDGRYLGFEKNGKGLDFEENRLVIRKMGFPCP